MAVNETKVDGLTKKSLLYIWYLFNSINKRLPFTVGVPFTEIVLSLVCLLNDLKAILTNYKIKIDKPMLQIYYYPHTDGRNSDFWPSSIDICNDAKFFDNVEDLLNYSRK